MDVYLSKHHTRVWQICLRQGSDKKLTRLINMFNNKIDIHSNRLQMTNKQRRYYPIKSLTRFHLSIAADLHISVNSISDDTHSASINTVSR